MICKNIFTVPPRPNGRRWSFQSYIDYVTIFLEILNPEKHPNCITGSKVTAILLNGLIFPIDGASLGRVCACSQRSKLVLQDFLRKIKGIWFETKTLGKIHNNYFSTVTVIIMSQKEESRSPGWHIKDNGHTYVYCYIIFLDNKSKLGARLD